MISDYQDENNLIKELKKGTSSAYLFLVKTYHHKLCVYVYSLTNDTELSEDIVQNVFTKIWSKRKRLKDNFSIKNYLYKSVYNEFIDQYRKKKKVIALEKKHIDALITIVEDDSKVINLVNLVKKEIENLPPKCKQTFLLSKQDGLTNIEIAEYLNISTKTVEAHITKAFSFLRKSLGPKANTILFMLFGPNDKKICKVLF